MNRRTWPFVLALLSLGILGSYLVYTEYLYRAIREESAVHTRMYAHVQEGLNSVEPGDEIEALLALQSEIRRLGVPMVVLDPTGEPTAAANLPFEADPAEPRDRERILDFVERLDRRNPPIETSMGTIHFGAPPVVRWLRWVPWLQVGGAVLVLMLGGGLVQVTLRAERERLWAAMARELAHQMGTPLSSLSGWVEVLGLDSDERRRLADDAHIAAEIGRDVERLERVSRRFELIGKKAHLRSVDAGAVVEELESYIRPRLPHRGRDVALSTRVARGLPPIRANRVLLVWALENILKNALDALAGRPGTIRIAALPGADDCVRLVIADNGPGIAPEVRGRIFEPGVTTKAGGWGVGLSLTRRIVKDLHGGRIDVRPRGGGGTQFVITLDAADADGRDQRSRRKRFAGDTVVET